MRKEADNNNEGGNHHQYGSRLRFFLCLTKLTETFFIIKKK